MKKSALSKPGLLGLALAALLLLSHTAVATPTQDVLAIDLGPLIDQSAKYPTRFAVDVPHPISTRDGGTWTQSGTRSIWTYSMRVPTAVSLSFHATDAHLPANAVLTVTGANGASASYRAKDVARSGLWSRPLPGDALQLSLLVDAAARPQTVIEIESFQAGYRSLGAGVPDNAHYHSLMQKAAQTGSCTLNYSCEVTSANQGPAHATVAIVVSGLVQCTGTLVNDTSGDGAAYVLTARHCENGIPGGGDPGAAANVTVYWDAQSPCGSALGSIYDSNTIAQTGATTIVEQQDAWLIQLEAPPAASDAYYAGWDATGGIFSGGYSIHHALNYDKQYTAWYGQPLLQTIPAATLGLQYSSNFWGVVNAMGNVGAGASGGALFDPNNAVVGSGTLALLTNGENSAGVCPANPLQPPGVSNLAAFYTTLSAVWNSTADTTSTTGSMTLQSVLDAAKTGALITGGIASLPVTLTIDQENPQTGQLVNLSWNAPGAQNCTASGGLSGDGWSGAKGASGSVALTEQTGSQVTYTIHCTAAGQVGFNSLTTTWQFVPADVQITGTAPEISAGAPLLLQWSANAQPCTASGGTSGDGWAGNKASTGSQTVVPSVLGSVTYTITCGSGGRISSNQYTTTVVPPIVNTINNDANNMRVGQTVTLAYGAAGSCTASGGAAGDGWAGPVQSGGTTVSVTETSGGTYTYTVTCTGVGATANLSSTNSVTLTFTNSAPGVSMSASPTLAELYTDPGPPANVNVNLAWTSNVRPCGLSTVGPGNAQFAGPSGPGVLPSETIAESAQVAGAYVYTLTCGTGQNQAQATATATFFTTAPSVTLTVPNNLPLGTPVTVAWNYNVYPCTGTGGQSGDGWAGGPKAAEFFGVASQTVTESATGNVTFGITCGSGSQIVQGQASASVVVPKVTITASASTLPVNGPLTLTWSSNVGTCNSSITPGSGGWGTMLQPTGSFETTEPVAGPYTYAINCAGVPASTQVSYTGSLVSLTASAASAPVETPVTLSWSAPQSGGTTCTASGGSPGDGWSGSLSASGTKTVTAQAVATVSYSITCNFGDGPIQAQTPVTYTPVTATDPATPTPQVSLSTSRSSQAVGSPVTISWTSENANECAASGGTDGDGWTGDLAPSGDKSVTESTAGSFSYGITCTGAPPAATAKTEVSFTTSSVTVTASSGKGGGGGALDPLYLLLLGVSLCRCWPRFLSQRAQEASVALTTNAGAASRSSESRVAIQSIRALAIDRPTLSAQQHVDPR